MNAKTIRIVARVGGGLVLGTLYTLLLLHAHLVAMMRPFGPDIAGVPMKDLAMVGTAIALATWALVGDDPFARAFRVTAFVVVVAAYGWTNLDWIFLLKGIYLSHGGFPGALDILLTAFPFLVLTLLVMMDRAARLARAYREKGVPEDECVDIARGVWVGGGRVLGTAVLIWVVAAAALLAIEGPAHDFAYLRAFLGPVVIAVVVAMAIVYMMRAKGARLRFRQDGPM